MPQKFLSLLLLLCVSSSHAWDLGPVGRFQFEKVNQGVYVMHGPLDMPNPANQGFMNNPGIVDVGAGLVMIDPGSSYPVGKKVLEELHKVSDKPILAVFNTHIHGDHWLGNQAVREAYPAARLYAHPAMIRQAHGSEGLEWLSLMDSMTEGASKGTELVVPEDAVQYGDSLEVGGHHFRIHGLSPAHTDTDIMIEHVESGTLFLGDNGFNGRMGRFDSSSSMHGTLDALHQVETLDIKVYVPGHGRSGNREQSLQPFMDYIALMRDSVKPGYEDGQADFEIKDAIVDRFSAFHDWAGFDDQFGRHVNKMYLEIEARDW